MGEENTAVFINKDKITGKHSHLSEDLAEDPELESCLDLPGEAFLENKFDHVSTAVLLDYLDNSDASKAKGKWEEDTDLWSFYNSGKGKGKFSFISSDLSEAFEQTKNKKDDVTKILSIFHLRVFKDGKLVEIPFFCELKDFILEGPNNFYEFTACLLVKEDGKNLLMEEYPWSFFVSVVYHNKEKSGDLQIIDYEK